MKYLMPFMILLLSSFTARESADLVIFNAKIYTVDSKMSIAEAMAVKDGRILAIGTKNDIVTRFEAAKTLDLDGKSVYPGFIDSHCHFYKYATMVMSMADLKGTLSMDEVMKVLLAYDKKYNPSWLTGRGWDQNDWKTKDFPDNRALNKMFPAKPVVLTRIDGHAVLVNDAAIRKAGITEKTIRKPEEAIYDAQGKFSGVFLEAAADLFKDLIPSQEQANRVRLLKAAEQECFSLGLTGVGDAGLDKQSVMFLDSLLTRGELKMKINVMLDPSEENFSTFLASGPVQKERLNIRAIKVYADGALGSRGACLLEPYSDDPGNKGLMNTSVEKLRSVCKLAYEQGFQVCTHAIGDSANRSVLKIYAEFLKGKNDRRWRIEHAQVVAPEDVPLFGKYAIVPAIQATHATSDMYWVEKRLGTERIKTAYAYKDLMQQNGWIPNGTDFPIEEINPLLSFYAAVSRQDQKGFPEGGFQSDNALSREEALRSITLWAAMAAFEENQKGSLEKGKLADFVVLDADIMTIPVSKVPAVKVLMTFSSGEAVFVH